MKTTKYIKDLNEAKKMNKFLMEYKNKIIKTKNYNISYKVLKKLKSVIKNIANIQLRLGENLDEQVESEIFKFLNLFLLFLTHK